MTCSRNNPHRIHTIQKTIKTSNDFEQVLYVILLTMMLWMKKRSHCIELVLNVSHCWNISAVCSCIILYRHKGYMMNLYFIQKLKLYLPLKQNILFILGQKILPTPAKPSLSLKRGKIPPWERNTYC